LRPGVRILRLCREPPFHCARPAVYRRRQARSARAALGADCDDNASDRNSMFSHFRTALTALRPADAE